LFRTWFIKQRFSMISGRLCCGACVCYSQNNEPVTMKLGRNWCGSLEYLADGFCVFGYTLCVCDCACAYVNALGFCVFSFLFAPLPNFYMLGSGLDNRLSVADWMQAMLHRLATYTEKKYINWILWISLNQNNNKIVETYLTKEREQKFHTWFSAGILNGRLYTRLLVLFITYYKHDYGGLHYMHGSYDIFKF